MGLRPRCFQTRQLALTARPRLPAAGPRRFLCQGPEPTGLPGGGSSAAAGGALPPHCRALRGSALAGPQHAAGGAS